MFQKNQKILFLVVDFTENDKFLSKDIKTIAACDVIMMFWQ